MKGYAVTLNFMKEVNKMATDNTRSTNTGAGQGSDNGSRSGFNTGVSDGSTPSKSGQPAPGIQPGQPGYNESLKPDQSRQQPDTRERN